LLVKASHHSRGAATGVALGKTGQTSSYSLPMRPDLGRGGDSEFARVRLGKENVSQKVQTKGREVGGPLSATKSNKLGASSFLILFILTGWGDGNKYRIHKG